MSPGRVRQSRELAGRECIPVAGLPCFAQNRTGLMMAMRQQFLAEEINLKRINGSVQFLQENMKMMAIADASKIKLVELAATLECACEARGSIRPSTDADGPPPAGSRH